MRFKCPKCKHPMQARAYDIGRRIRCPECDKEIIFLKPPSEPILFACPGCDRKYKIRKEMAGKRARCPQCDISFIVLKKNIQAALEKTKPSPPTTPEQATADKAAVDKAAADKAAAELQLSLLRHEPKKTGGRKVMMTCGVLTLILIIGLTVAFMFISKRMVEKMHDDRPLRRPDTARKPDEPGRPLKEPRSQPTPTIAKRPKTTAAKQSPEIAPTTANPFVKEKMRLESPQTFIRAFSLSADGQKLATLGGRTVRLWDLTQGKELKLVAQEDSSQMGAIAFSPDGNEIAWGVYNKIKLQNLNDPRLSRTLQKHTNTVFSIAFSPDGQWVASGEMSNRIKIWHAAGGDAVHTLNGHSGRVHSVRFSPDGRILASASRDMTIKFWDPSSGQELRTLRGHWEPILCLSFSPDGTLLASGSENGTIKLWNVADGTQITQIENAHARLVKTVSFSPDGRILASGGGYHTIRLWRLPQGELLTTFQHEVKSWEAEAVQVAFAGDSRTLVSAGWDRTMRVWDVQTEALLKQKAPAQVPQTQSTVIGKPPVTAQNRFKGMLTPLAFVAISPDGQMYAAGDKTGRIEIRGLTNGDAIHSFQAHFEYVESVEFSPDSQTLLSLGRDHGIKLWNVKDGMRLGELNQTRIGYSQATFTPDNTHLVCGDLKGRVRFFNLANMEKDRSFTAHVKSIRRLAFSPHGKLLLTGARDGDLKLWQIADLEPVGAFSGSRKGVKSACFSPDSRHLLYIDKEQNIILYQLADGTVVQKFPKMRHSVKVLRFHPEGQWFVSGSFDRIHFWDISQTHPFLSIKGGHYNPIQALGFSSDGQTLVSIGMNNSVKAWKPEASNLKTLRAANQGKDVLYSSAQFYHGHAQGLNRSRRIRETFKLKKGLKIREIAILIKGIDITDTSSWPLLALHGGKPFESESPLAEPRSQQISNAFAQPTFTKNRTPSEPWYWMAYTFAEDLTLQPGDYYVQLRVEQDRHIDHVSWIKGSQTADKKRPSKGFLKIVGETL